MPLASVAVTVKLLVAATVGVPLIVPVLDPKDRLVGSDPAVTENVGAAQPEVPTVCEYADPTVPPGRLAVVMVQTGVPLEVTVIVPAVEVK